MQYLILFTLGAIAVVSVVFALQNSVPITVNLLLWNFESSLALVLIITLVSGIIIGILAALYSLLRKSWHETRLKKRVKELEQELSQREAAIAEITSSQILGAKDAQAATE